MMPTGTWALRQDGGGAARGRGEKTEGRGEKTEGRGGKKMCYEFL